MNSGGISHSTKTIILWHTFENTDIETSNGRIWPEPNQARRLKKPLLSDSSVLLKLLPLTSAMALAVVLVLVLQIGEEHTRRSNQILQTNMPVFGRVQALLHGVSYTEVWLYRLLHSKQTDAEADFHLRSQAFLHRWDNLHDQLDAEMSRFLRNFNKEQQDSIRREYVRFLPMLQESREMLTRLLAEAPGSEAIATQRINTASGQYLAIDAQSAALQRAMTTAMHEEFTGFSIDLNNQLTRTTFEGMAVFLLAILFTSIIIRTIEANISRTGKALQRLAADPSSLNQAELAKDPAFSALSDVARSMAKTQAELLATNQELESERKQLKMRVRESTDHLLNANKSLRDQITEREEAEKKLKLYKTIVDSTDEAILISDKNNQIIEVNEAYLEHTGFSRNDVIGQDPGITRSGRHDQGFYDAMWQSLKHTGKWRGEIWDRRKNGDIFPKLLAINLVRDDHGEVLYHIGIFWDITEQKETEKKLATLAFNDPLTGLPNRALFRDRLNHELERATRNRSPFSLLFLDLDGFKPVNDQHGHDVGDALLVQVAQRIRHCLRQSDTLARLGGDEFTVILPDSGDMETQKLLAQKVIDRIHAPFQISGHSIQIGVSIGVARFPTDGVDYLNLTRHADLAMYKAKQAGKGQCAFYSTVPTADFQDTDSKLRH